MLLQEGANSIVNDTILDSSVGAAAKIVKEPLRDGQKIELTVGSDRFYSYPNALNLEKLTVEVPAPLKTFLEMIYSKSQTETAEEKKDLSKVAVAHALMQFCKNKDIYLHSLWRLDCPFTKFCELFLVDVLHSLWFSVSYSEVRKFEKCAAVSSVMSDDFVSETELESENRFWQFIADNFDHNGDTTTGANTTHAMEIISCETPKSEFTFQPIEGRYFSKTIGSC